MCGILAVLGCSDDSQAKRVRVLELSRRQIIFLNYVFLCLFYFLFFGWSYHFYINIGSYEINITEELLAFPTNF